MSLKAKKGRSSNKGRVGTHSRPWVNCDFYVGPMKETLANNDSGNMKEWKMV